MTAKRQICHFICVFDAVCLTNYSLFIETPSRSSSGKSTPVRVPSNGRTPTKNSRHNTPVSTPKSGSRPPSGRISGGQNTFK